MQDSLRITSLQNSRVKNAVKLRQRSHRDTEGRLLVEGYREILRALDNGHQILELFYCPELFMGHNEQAILNRARGTGTSILECSEPVFRKIAYRDRPEGLLAIAPQIRRGLQDISLPQNPLVLVAESIEKPGNLGTILRTADAVGAAAVIVCDRCTDLNNPNVVRASIGTVFSVQVAEAGSAETLEWLKLNGVKVVCSTPHTDTTHTEADLSGPVAILLGSEQYGASKAWMEASDLQVRIPMMGQADSLNVASAAAVLLFEALRQRLTTSAKPAS